MKEWFKARNVWGATILALSDEEAGRIAKAIWSYTMNGEILPLEGAEKGIIPMILMTLAQDEDRENEISAKRSHAAKTMHLQANADKCKQMIANASNCSNKNKNKNKEQESESESYIADDDAHEIQSEQNRVLDAAEDAGFKMSNDVRASLISLYADNGLQKMLDGFKACAEYGVPTLAYLKGVLKGGEKKPKQGKPAKVVIAQQYEQRDYAVVQDDVEEMQRKRMAERMREMNAG